MSAPGGVPAWSRRGCLLRGRGLLLGVSGLDGGYLPGPGGGLPGQILPPVNRMNDRCKNITLAKTSFRPVTRLCLASAYPHT